MTCYWIFMVRLSLTFWRLGWNQMSFTEKLIEISLECKFSLLMWRWMKVITYRASRTISRKWAAGFSSRNFRELFDASFCFWIKNRPSSQSFVRVSRNARTPSNGLLPCWFSVFNTGVEGGAGTNSKLKVASPIRLVLRQRRTRAYKSLTRKPYWRRVRLQFVSNLRVLKGIARNEF